MKAHSCRSIVCNRESYSMGLISNTYVWRNVPHKQGVSGKTSVHSKLCLTLLRYYFASLCVLFKDPFGSLPGVVLRRLDPKPKNLHFKPLPSNFWQKQHLTHHKTYRRTLAHTQEYLPYVFVVLIRLTVKLLKLTSN